MDQHRGFGVGSGKGDPAGEAAEPIAGDGRAGFAFDGQQGLAVVGEQVDLVADVVAPEEQVRAFAALIAAFEQFAENPAFENCAACGVRRQVIGIL